MMAGITSQKQFLITVAFHKQTKFVYIYTKLTKYVALFLMNIKLLFALK